MQFTTYGTPLNVNFGNTKLKQKSHFLEELPGGTTRYILHYAKLEEKTQTKLPILCFLFTEFCTKRKKKQILTPGLELRAQKIKSASLKAGSTAPLAGPKERYEAVYRPVQQKTREKCPAGGKSTPANRQPARRSLTYIKNKKGCITTTFFILGFMQ